MSQFDYPRIIFSGKAIIDVATANNCFYLPLVIFDPIGVEVIIPPKLYINESVLVDGKSSDDIEELLPSESVLKTDLTGLYAGVPYIEIAPINSDEIFREWAKTPLGKYELDEYYWPLYECVQGEKSGKLLKGVTPGYWNFYGSMQYWFEDAIVSSISVFDPEQGERIYEAGSNGCPDDLHRLFGSKLTMNQVNPDGRSFNTGIMIDTEPTFSIMTQVFADVLRLANEETVHFSGHPYNAPCRFLNPFRILNEDVPLNSSCNFVSTIPIDRLSQREDAQIIRLFKKHGSKPPSQLKGISVIHNLFEIGESRPFDYVGQGEISNPAIGSVVGYIVPWYAEDELQTLKMGRQLNAVMPFMSRPKFVPPVAMLPPTTFEIDYEHQFLSLDFLNSIPEQNLTLGLEGGVPQANKEYQYETHDLGELKVFIIDDQGVENLLGKFTLDANSYPRSRYLKTGGMIKIPFSTAGIDDQVLRTGTLSISGNGINPGTGLTDKNAQLMIESQYMIGTDQTALYVDQFSDPSKGYRCFSGEREPCVLRIFEKGEPVKEAIDISIIRYEYKLERDVSCDISLHGTDKYKDGDTIGLPTERPGGTVYRFVPGEIHYTKSKSAFDVLSTSFYTVLRVLSRQRYARYFDQTHPHYPTPITWDVLRKEIFRTYELIYPIMSKMKLPFQREIWENPKMARELVDAISLDNWDSSWYMPFTRELSTDQIKLIQIWAEPYLNEEQEQPPSDTEEYHRNHLEGSPHFPFLPDLGR